MNSNTGFCAICEKDVTFVEHETWLRDFYQCECCHSIPRQRALVNALNTFIPMYKTLKIHESSPGGVVEDYFKRVCNDYSVSQFFRDVKLGTYKNGVRCENLECMTFDDESFDIFITQDVFEHVLNPGKAFAEIGRVLRNGGIHIFTLPWYPEKQQSVQRVYMDNDKLVYLAEPVYHGNPINSSGSIVTYDWGLDLVDFIYEHSRMTTMIYLYKDRNLGLDAEFLHVFLSFKTQNQKETLLQALNRITAEKDAQYQDFINSTSWKITGPLRAIKKLITGAK